MNIKYSILTLIFTYFVSAQNIIAPDLHSEDLIDYLNIYYKTNSVLSYNNARDVLYSEIDNNNGDVYGIYTNYSVTLDFNADPSTHLYENGMNCEHVWPQSMYEIISANHMKSDMHHLRPCKENVNTSRGNKPFNEIENYLTNTWFWLTYQTNNIPSNNIDEYSESGSNYFEPREDVKGDIARSMFYFYTMYTQEADNTFFEDQKETLKEWHYLDLPDNDNLDRTWQIATYQNDIPNPFVVDSTLIRRCYFYLDFIDGDINNDGLANIVDVVILVNYILGYQTLNTSEFNQADIDNNNMVNIIDAVLLVEIIIS